MKINLLPVLKLLIIIFSSFFLLTILIRVFAYFYAANKSYDLTNAPKSRIAIVFGAGLRRDGTPMPVLRDRVATAVELYKSGKVEKVLMTGDNRFVNYNEPAAMAAYARDMGIAQKDLVLDYAGRSTYDSCYRAKAIFKVDQAILVTQSFHLPRALFICNQLGVSSTGVSADRRHYWLFSIIYWQLREMPATLAALWDVWISKPIPVLGESEPIIFNQKE